MADATFVFLATPNTIVADIGGPQVGASIAQQQRARHKSSKERGDESNVVASGVGGSDNVGAFLMDALGIDGAAYLSDAFLGDAYLGSGTSGALPTVGPPADSGSDSSPLVCNFLPPVDYPREAIPVADLPPPVSSIPPREPSEEFTVFGGAYLPPRVRR